MNNIDNSINGKEYTKPRYCFIHNGGKCQSLTGLIKDEDGFTLVELIVVLVIIAVLAATVGPAFIGYIGKARKNGALNDAKKVYLAVQSITDQAHSDLVTPDLYTDDVKERITEITDVPFDDGSHTYSVVFVNNSFDDNNPTNAMYSIREFTYSDGIYTATYKKNAGSGEEIWTVTEN